MPPRAVASPASRRRPPQGPGISHPEGGKETRSMPITPLRLQQRPLCPAPPNRTHSLDLWFLMKNSLSLSLKVFSLTRTPPGPWGAGRCGLGVRVQPLKPHIPTCPQQTCWLVASSQEPRPSRPCRRALMAPAWAVMAARLQAGLSGWPLAQNTPYALHRMFQKLMARCFSGAPGGCASEGPL